ELHEILGGTGDGKIDRIGRVVEIDEDVVSPPGRHAPRVLVGAIPMQCFARRVLRAEPMDVARIILDFVVARAPRGERNEQGVLAGRGEIRGHVELPRTTETSYRTACPWSGDARSRTTGSSWEKRR